MDVDAECTDDDLFEDGADAMDEDDPGQSRKGRDEDPAVDDDDDGDENPTTVPKFKARTKVTNVGHKDKAKHPSFLIEGPASGGSTSFILCLPSVRFWLEARFCGQRCCT